MNKIAQIRSYIFTPKLCYPPICKSTCCEDVPLPEGFYENFHSRAQRQITGSVNIGKNDPRDPFNSIIYNTTKIPILPIGFGSDGRISSSFGKEKNLIACVYDEEMLKELGKDNEEGRREMREEYKKNTHRNYCPFIMYNGRCSVYEQRPGICREFGTLPGSQNRCTHKASRFDIAKYWIKAIFDFKSAYKFYKDLIIKQFGKVRNSSKTLIRTPIH